MILIIILLRLIYVICLSVLTLYAAGTVYILYSYLKHFHKDIPLPRLTDSELPKVTVQLPLFNERYVARRILDAVAQLDYPREKLHIQILDDSTDDTTEIIQARVKELQAEGLRVDMIHRTNRQGYKAGALAEGMPLTDGEFIALFDADFVPDTDFLRRTIPYFSLDKKIGVVQARWGHLNADDNILTRAQALAIDGHFGVEQFARCNNNLIFSFNGTCGLWRRTCIVDAGGWQADTLTEDFDLSYRAHMRGWRFYYVRDVMCPGELPAQMGAYKQQQTRWAKGSTQVLVKLAWALMYSNLSLRIRIMGILQLLQYAIQLFILTSLVLAPIMLLTHSLDGLPLAPLSIMSLAAPILFVLGQQALHQNWKARIIYFPMLMILSSGLVINNSRASIEALLGKPSEFKRTPKFRLTDGRSTNTWQRSQYATLVGIDIIWELLLCLYTFMSMVISVVYAPSFVPYFFLYFIGPLTVASWSLSERWVAMHPPRPSSPAPTEAFGSAGD